MDAFDLWEVWYERFGKRYGRIVFIVGVVTAFAGFWLLLTARMELGWRVFGLGFVLAGVGRISSPFTWMTPFAKVTWTPLEPFQLSRYDRNAEYKAVYNVLLGVVSILFGLGVVLFHHRLV